jgi:hypothetical protein
MPVDLAAMVERLGAQLGLSALSVTATSVCELQLADGLALTFELAAGRDTLFLHVPVGRVPTDSDELAGFCEDLLRRNDFEEAEDGSTLGIDPRHDEAILWHAFAADELEGYEAFLRAVEAFARRGGELTQALGTWTGRTPPERSDDPLFMFANFVRG